jgi:uncharacterized protein
VRSRVSIFLALLAALAATAPAHADALTLPDLERTHDRAGLEQALAQHADVNARAADGSTALQWAVYDGDIALVRRLLRAGADVRVANNYGATAMQLGADAADPMLLQALLDAGADADSPNADGQTALMLVARTNRVDAAQLLLRHGAHVNLKEGWREQTALMWAAAQGQPQMLRLLLKHGADPNARSSVNHWARVATAEPRQQNRPSGGLTALLYAARQGCVECVRELVRGHADVNLGDPDGVTPLLMATLNAHFDTAAQLLHAGADPNRWDKWGRTPLYAAIDYNTLPTGGRPDQPSPDAVTPLDFATQLLAAHADPDAQLRLLPPFRDLREDRGGDGMLGVGTTALVRAAKAGDADAVKLLLAHGADPNLATAAGITPLHAATGIGSFQLDTRGHNRTEPPCLEVAKLLVAAHAQLSLVDNTGRTPLFGAASWGYNSMIRYLVAAGARVDAKDNQGFTPADAALGKGAGPVRFGITPEVHTDSAALLQQLQAGNTLANSN